MAASSLMRRPTSREPVKLMNRVSAGHAGVVRSVLVPDASPVEFDQPLIALDPLPEFDGGQR